MVPLPLLTVLTWPCGPGDRRDVMHIVGTDKHGSVDLGDVASDNNVLNGNDTDVSDNLNGNCSGNDADVDANPDFDADTDTSADSNEDGGEDNDEGLLGGLL